MIASILERKKCKTCGICCKYDEDDIWDAPSFSKEEFELARSLVSTPAYNDHGMIFFQMSQKDGEYICPLLGENGCKLGKKKPFKCAIWPLYVVYYETRLSLAVSEVCPIVSRLTNEEIVSGLGETILKIAEMARAVPERIEPLRENFRFVCFME